MKVKRLKPDLPKALLLEGEYALIENREEAKLLLQPPVADLDTPAWIKDMAEGFLDRVS